MNNEQIQSTVASIIIASLGGVLGRYFDSQTTLAICTALALVTVTGIRIAQKRLDGLINSAASAVAADPSVAKVVIESDGAVKKVATAQ